MSEAAIDLPAVVISDPAQWIGYRDGERIFYADPLYARGDEGKPLDHLDFDKSRLVLQRLGLRNPTDREYNLMMTEPQSAREKVSRPVWTGYMRDCVKHGDRYTGMYNERPEIVVSSSGSFAIVGSERKVDLPPTGWFRIKELLKSGGPFPETTLPQFPYPFRPGHETEEDPFAYFCVYEGNLDIVRGGVFTSICNRSPAHWKFDYTVGRSVVGTGGCMMAVSDERPQIQVDVLRSKAMAQRTKGHARQILEDIDRSMREGLSKIEALRKDIDNI